MLKVSHGRGVPRSVESKIASVEVEKIGERVDIVAKIGERKFRRYIGGHEKVENERGGHGEGFNERARVYGQIARAPIDWRFQPSSNRATIVHYYQNDRIVHPNDLCLMDAGCEMNGYVSDITRVWAGGSETASFVNDYQKAVYDRVCDVRAAVLAKLERDIRSQTPVFVTRFTRCMRRCDVRCPRRLAPVSNRRRVHHQKLASLQRQIRPILPPRRLPLARHGHSRHAFNSRLHFHRKRRLFLRRTGLYFDPNDTTLPKSLPASRESRGRGSA